jgi:RNA polymerase sigma-70 factor, ECF subfamily
VEAGAADVVHGGDVQNDAAVGQRKDLCRGPREIAGGRLPESPVQAEDGFVRSRLEGDVRPPCLAAYISIVSHSFARYPDAASREAGTIAPGSIPRIVVIPTNFSPPTLYFSPDEDAALVRQALTGDTRAFGTLVDHYQRVLYTVAVRMLGNREDAKDATQTAFVRAFERLSTFDPSYRFFSWMYRILVNECLNVLKSRRPVEPLESVAPAIAAAGNPFEAIASKQRRAQVEAALLQLSPEHRAVIVLRHFTGLSYDEIAEAIGVPAKTVKSRLHSARQRLGELLFGWRTHDAPAGR